MSRRRDRDESALSKGFGFTCGILLAIGLVAGITIAGCGFVVFFLPAYYKVKEAEYRMQEEQRHKATNRTTDPPPADAPVKK